MLTRSEAVTIVSFGQWNINGQLATRKDGSPAEFVEVQVAGEEKTRKFTLDPSINGGRPEAGSRSALDVDHVMKAEVRTAGDGRQYVGYKDQLIARAFHPVR